VHYRQAAEKNNYMIRKKEIDKIIYNKSSFTTAFIATTIFASLIIFLFALQPSFAADLDFNVDKAECNMATKGMAANIVNCINAILDYAAAVYIQSVVKGVGDIVATACTLAIMFFGVKAVFGLQNPRQDTAMLIIKLVIVAAVCLKVGSAGLIIDWRNYIVGGSEAIGNLVASGFENTDSCMAGGEHASGVFEKFDCIALKMLGLDNTRNFATILLVVTSSFFLFGPVGPIGFLFTILFFLFIFMLIRAMVQSLFIYLTASIALTFLISLTPLMVPMILFEKTKKITSQWINHILVYSLQPAFLIAFLVLTFVVLDDIALMMGRVYGLVEQSANDPEKNKTVSVIKFNSTSMDESSFTPEMQEEKEKMEAAGVEQVPEEAWFSWLPSADGVIKGAWNNISSGFLGIFAPEISGRVIEMPVTTKREFIGTQIAAILLLAMMVSFLKQLPNIASRMIGQGIVESVIDSATSATKLASQAVRTGAKAAGGAAIAPAAAAGAAARGAIRGAISGSKKGDKRKTGA